jgi:hypothetical protein
VKTTVVDVVNFNCDASCLPASHWLEALSGGERSTLCQWLNLYVEEDRPVVIGFTGATVADMAILNPEAIAVVNGSPQIFEIILRPFSHDIALLRTAAGFEFNVAAGRKTIEHEFVNVSPYFLPAEFMLTNSQVHHLAKTGVRGTFVNAARFKTELKSRIPDHPYLVHGVFSSTLRCLPIRGELAEAYLQSLHYWDPELWNQAIVNLPAGASFSWRDGESFLLVPSGLERERAWLNGQNREVELASIAQVERGLNFREPDDAFAYRSFPVHSFSDWMKEFRMLGYLERCSDLERHLEALDISAKTLWLQAINSDVLSAVEKESPTIRMRTLPRAHSNSHEIVHTIRRSERGFEGEEFLEMLDSRLGQWQPRNLPDASLPHLRKYAARCEYLTRLLS